MHVPAYPDFTVHSLAIHIGRVLRLFHGVVAGDGEQYLAADAPDAGEHLLAEQLERGVELSIGLVSVEIF